MSALSPEQGPPALSSPEKSRLIVSQPAKLAELSQLLETIEVLPRRISERVGEDRSGDMGAGGAMAAQGDDRTAVSPRNLAIAQIPSPEIIQKKLREHIEQEVQKLNALATLAARASGPGAAFRLNELYARIRRLNALLAEILEAAVDVLRRLYIRVFIDQQPIV